MSLTVFGIGTVFAVLVFLMSLIGLVGYVAQRWSGVDAKNSESDSVDIRDRATAAVVAVGVLMEMRKEN